MEDFGCSNKTAIKLLRELEQQRFDCAPAAGIGQAQSDLCEADSAE